MGIDHTACFGYGFEFEGEEEDLPEGLKIIYHGSSYWDERQTEIVCIKESIIRGDMEDDASCTKKEKLIVKPEWDDILKAFADECCIEDPEIGWYLCLNEW